MPAPKSDAMVERLLPRFLLFGDAWFVEGREESVWLGEEINTYWGERRTCLVRGRNKYLMRRKAKHLGFLTEFEFQWGRFMLKAYMKNAWSLDFE
jgi:hypothetical protein